MTFDSHLGGYIHGSDPNTWYPELWTWLRERYDIRSVLDVGCGEGYSARFWRLIGCDVLGVEGDPGAIAHSVIPDAVRLHDFTGGPFTPGRTFDSVWCCEVVEHIDEAYVPHIMDTFAQARVIAMTHAVPGQPGHHHVNCKPSAYWARHLATRGYHLQYGPTRQARTRAHHYFCRTGMIFTRDRTLLPSVLAVYLLELEWFPRRLWRHLRVRGLIGIWRTLRPQGARVG